MASAPIALNALPTFGPPDGWHESLDSHYSGKQVVGTIFTNMHARHHAVYSTIDALESEDDK